jgi:two-component system, NarL family, response regulator DevR
MDEIRVIIVDDHPVFRYGLRSLLAQDLSIKIAGEAENGADALALLERVHPDIMLLDIHLPGPNGIELAQRIRTTFPDVKIIILTAYESDEYVLEALRAGVSGYLLKSSSNEIIQSAIHTVHAGQKLLNSGQVNLVLTELENQTRQHKHDQYDLTDLEIKILGYLAQGDTLEDIGKHIYLSEPTVKRMVGTILTKLGASNRTQAVADAIRNGLI